jgi:hypothetical protein
MTAELENMKEVGINKVLFMVQEKWVKICVVAFSIVHGNKIKVSN